MSEDAIAEEAAIWHARLREDMAAGPLRNTGTRHAFERWLAEDPRHREAFREMEWLWGALREPVDTKLAARRRQPARHRRLAMVACLLVAVVAGVAWQQDWRLWLTSDYVTAAGESHEVRLPDGSEIILNAASALSVEYTERDRAVSLLKGEALFQVTGSDPRAFTVNTPQGRVRVTGTAFNVRLDEEAAVVSLLEGEVVLSSRDRSAEVSLKPGEQSWLSRAGITAPSAFDPMRVSDWTRGQIVFYDSPLAEVVARLERHRRGRIVIADADLRQLRVSGVFSTEAPDAALEAIGDTLGIEQTRVTDWLVLLH